MKWKLSARSAPKLHLHRYATERMMTEERFSLIPEAHLFLIENGRILLLRRRNTGYEDGKYGVVAGHLDGGETATQAMAREAFEEAGILLEPQDLTLAHVMHRRHRDERLSFFFFAREWRGIPENTIPYIQHAIACYEDSILYSEFGWKGPA